MFDVLESRTAIAVKFVGNLLGNTTELHAVEAHFSQSNHELLQLNTVCMKIANV